MKKLIVLPLLLLFFFVNAQAQQTGKINLSAAEFEAKIQATPELPLIDVRTPEEFAQGHLKNARNIDWYGTSFDKDIATLDKNKPVFLYCRSGGRSTAAINKMLAAGFTEIYELTGGITAWRAASLPVSF